ncbi:hypothetical protein DICSQDRAFT_136289 [Dichomitus squalens LYAD-421 SS1]|uniref:Uncharacterized protein n=2 Tax=Dichomitus squalens TaxID=114155 RepID=A0A4Q9QA06_9APHY|nr:uncharacterized protein DICSQDRAFT_136289 [Dichomitus squalens LYAD-421 SS1]EJF61773.1 hypothetical protein DICSQDRAFT_136289 [Dichomitus squalens LYAD-421 SS1]TBU63464.1 hypothetical protein BD310DRAFT_945039 [Dichomitus squalens]
MFFVNNVHTTLLGKRHGQDASSRAADDWVEEDVPKALSSDAPTRIFVAFAVNDDDRGGTLRGQNGALDA